MWADDGGKCNFLSGMLGFRLYAEHGYRKEIDLEELKKRVKFCTGVDYEAFMDLKYLDETPGTTPDNLNIQQVCFIF